MESITARPRRREHRRTRRNICWRLTASSTLIVTMLAASATDASFADAGTIPPPIVGALTPAGGLPAGGKTVAVTGTNLGGATSVTVDGAPVSFTPVNKGKVTFTAPAHPAGPVQVRISTPSGTSATGPNSQYLYQDAPRIGDVEPSEGSVKGGDTVTVSGTNLSGATAVLFGGTPAPSFTVESSTSISVVTPAHAKGKIIAQVQTPSGRTSPRAGRAYFYYFNYPSVTIENSVVIGNQHGTQTALSCADLDNCTAVDDGGYALPFSRTGVAQPVAVQPGVALTAISCPTATTCFATDTAGNVSMSNPGGWAPPVGVDSGHQLVSIACPSAGFCLAGDADGRVVVYRGGIWRTPRQVSSSGISGLSCSSVRFCVITAGTESSRYNGTAFAAGPVFDAAPTSVSCPVDGFCMVVGIHGQGWTTDGTTATPANPVIAANGRQVKLSCTSTTFCLMESNGFYETWNGAAWSDGDYKATPSVGNFAAVDCTTGSTCALVDDLGNTYVTAARS